MRWPVRILGGAILGVGLGLAGFGFWPTFIAICGVTIISIAGAA